MYSNVRELAFRSWRSGASITCFLVLLVVVEFVLPSIGFERNNLQLYGDIVFSIVLVFGCAVAWENRRLFVLASLVSLAAIIVRWLAWYSPTRTLELWSVATGLIGIVAITAVLFWQVFRPGPVTAVRVQGAIAAYLGIASIWAHAYHIAAILDPSAFNITGSNISAPTTWVNYSFGVLTTIGYPGIVPVEPLAHTLGSAEAVTGQLYLAILVARLVSLQVVATHGERVDRVEHPVRP
jgi:hypothetical protein